MKKKILKKEGGEKRCCARGGENLGRREWISGGQI